MSVTNVGLIGVGKMGVGLAKNLLEADYKVYAYDLVASNIDPVDEFGVVRCYGVREVAEAAEIVITCLPSIDAVREVYDGDDGLVHIARPGSILIDCTSNDPILSRELGEKAKSRGIEMVDAPILRGMEHAWAGTIQLVVGGSDAALETCRPLFEAVAEDTILVGQHGNGHMVKALNNQVTLINHMALCESFTVARKMGVDLETLFQVLDASQASSKKLHDLAPRLINGNHEVSISIDAFAKDSGNFIKLAKSIGAQVSVAESAYGVFRQASEDGLGESAPTRIATMLAGIAGTEFPDQDG
jgi:3-hydroxyisobutyrate dehydrogenase-like beta-hydroxyacid dehydrogenase